MTPFKQWLPSAIPSTNPVAVPNAIILPLAVFALVVIISRSYKEVKQLQLSPAKKQHLIDIHALATECCQLSLVVLLISDTVFIVERIIQLTLSGDISTTNAALLIEAAVVGSFVIHVIAIFAVDLIEGRILLETWTHPYKWQPFVLTRRWIFGYVENKRLQQRGRDKQGVNDQMLEQDVSDSKLEAEYRIANLKYLDLAGLDQRQQSRKMHNQSWISTIDTAPV